MLFLYFLLGNFVLSTFCAVYCIKNTFIILRSSFFGFLLSEKSKQNVNLDYNKQQFVRGRAVLAKDVHTVCARS